MFPFTHGVIASSSAQTVSTDFIIRVKTDNAGTSASNQFTLPTATGTYNYDVDWGDGVIENITTSTSQTHTYPTSGTYTIKISGTFPRINFNNLGDRLKVIELVNLGDVGWNNMGNSFYGCANMIMNNNCTGVFTLVASCVNAFRSCGMPSIQPLFFPNATTFEGFARGNNIAVLPLFQFPSATNMSNAFRENALEFVPAISFPSATRMDSAFANNGVIDSFLARDFYAMTNGALCFNGTTLPTSDYSDILVTQRANNPNNSVTFHGGSSKYNTAGGVARGELVSIQSWSITDGGAE